MTKPIIKGLDKPITVDLGKRLEYIGGVITFVCPECGYEMEQLNDTADLEYGCFHGLSDCWDCGTDFDTEYFEVSATITISRKGE